MAKGLTSAYAPLGAVAMKPEIASAFDERVFQSGLTFSSHGLASGGGGDMREDKIVERLEGRHHPGKHHSGREQEG